MPNLSSLFGRGKEQRDPETGETRQGRAHREQMDREVIQSLRKNGSNMSKPHRLEHHFIADTNDPLRSLAVDELTVGYEATEVIEAEYQGGTYYYVDLMKAIVPTEANIFAESKRMNTLARRYGVQYDGWGCLTEK